MVKQVKAFLLNRKVSRFESWWVDMEKFSTTRLYEEAKAKLFALNLPVYYAKEGWLVAEYKDGTIRRVKQLQWSGD